MTGKTTKHNQKPAKTKVFNLNLPSDPVISYDRIQRLVNNWIPFGTNNLFPQAIASINRKSTINRGIINSKTIYTIGQGFNGSESSLTKAKEINLRETLKRSILDRYAFGNAFIEVVRRDGFVSVFHHDATTCRIHKSNNYIIIHPDWANWTSLKSEFKVLPKYPIFENIDGFERTMIHFKDYEPQFVYNGVPDWIAGLKVSVIGHKTDKWNLTRLDNDFRGSGVLVVEDDIKSEEEAYELKNQVMEEFTGEDGGGLVVIAKTPGADINTNFTEIKQTQEGNWEKLHSQAATDMIIAHSWYRSLTAIPDNNGFDTKRILNEYQIALNTVIADKQEEFMSVLNEVLMTDLQIINKPPLDYGNLLDINKFITKNEGRKMFGLEENNDNTYIDVSNTSRNSI